MTVALLVPGCSQIGIITSYLSCFNLLFLPLKSLDSVAYERSAQERAELFGCLQSGSLSGAAGRKNHRHREVHAAFRRFVLALLGLAGWEKPWMSGPVWVTVIGLHVDVIHLHQLVDGGSRQVIPKTAHSQCVGGV